MHKRGGAKTGNKAKTNLVKVPEKPRAVIIMEERAKQRKEKRELLKKLYEDKRSREMAFKIDEENKKEEEHKQRVLKEKEAKKQAKLEELRQKEIAKKEAEEF